MQRRKVAGATKTTPPDDSGRRKVAGSDIGSRENPYVPVPCRPCMNCLHLDSLLYLHVMAMQSARRHLREAKGGSVAHALEDLERHIPEWKGPPNRPCP